MSQDSLRAKRLTTSVDADELPVAGPHHLAAVVPAPQAAEWVPASIWLWTRRLQHPCFSHAVTLTRYFSSVPIRPTAIYLHFTSVIFNWRLCAMIFNVCRWSCWSLLMPLSHARNTKLYLEPLIKYSFHTVVQSSWYYLLLWYIKYFIHKSVFLNLSLSSFTLIILDANYLTLLYDTFLLLSVIFHCLLTF
jgi:hypothetical protein